MKPRLGAGATVALLAAIIFPILGGWQIIRTREAIITDARHDARTLSHSLAQHASRILEEVDFALAETVENVEQNDSPARLTANLRRGTAMLQQLSDMAIVDPKGDWTIDTLVPSRSINSASRSYFQWHREHADRAMHIGDMIVGEADGNPTLTLSRRITTKAGDFAGVVRAGLNPDYLQTFYDSIEIGQKGTIALWRDTGGLLVRHPTLPGIGERALPHGSVGDLFTTVHAGVRQSPSPIDGVDRIVAFEHLESYPLVVSAAVAVDDALSGWRHETLIEVIVLGIASIGLVSLAFGLQGHQRRAALSDLKSRRADAMYRLLADNSSDLIALKPRGASQQTYVSPSATAIVGWSPDEFARIEASDIIHPDDLERVLAEVDQISPERPRIVSQHRVRHKSGHIIWVEASMQWTTLDAGAPVMVTTTRDITARRLAEEALKDSEARYRLLAESSSDMVTRASPDGAVLYASPASVEVTGYQPADLVGTSITQFIHPDDAERVWALIEKSRARGMDTVRLLYRVSHKRGHWIWVEVQMRHVREAGTDRPVEIVANVRDVTERQLLQQQVEASARLLRLTLDSMDQGLVVLSPDRRCNVWNARALTLLELTVPDGARAADQPTSRTALRAEQRFPWIAAIDLTEEGKPAEHRLPNGVVLEVRHTSMPGGESLLTFSDITHLKRAESEAREANRMLLLAEELALVGHWRWDIANNQVWWSKQIYRIHGLDPDSAPPSMEEALDFFHPDDRASVQHGIAHAIANRQGYTLPLRAVHADGTIRHLVSRNLVEVDPVSGEVVALFGAIMDVTELAHTQRELSEKSSWLETTLNNMDQGLVTVENGGSVSLTNRRFAELLDLPAALLDRPGLDIADVWAHLGPANPIVAGDPDAPPHLAGWAPALGTHEYTCGDGRVLEVRTVPLPGGAVIQTYSDITIRRQAEFKVRDSEARYRMLAESTSDVITQLGLDLSRRYVSSSCRGMLGYEPEEMLGTLSSAAMIHPDDIGEVRAAVENLIAGAVQGGQITRTYRMRHKDGRWVWLENAINLVCDHRGAPESLICSLRDVTERQRTAEHLHKARAAAENAARLKTEFVANMSHELRTPLTGILGIHDMLAQDPTLGPGQKRYVSIAREAGRALLAIVNDVLDFSKIEAGELTIERLPFDVRALIVSCHHLATEQASGKPVAVTASVEEAACVLLGDAARLRQILLNLITNAIKFTEAGTVGINASYRRELGRLRIEIVDTGIGIAAAKIPLLFKRFSQADTSTTRRYGGTGLGLAISKRLVDLMGGEIGVDSVVGHGTTFWIELPLAEAFEDQDRPADERRPSTLVPCRVLLAEDNVVNQEIISAVLEQRGHAVTIVENGAAATAAVVGTSDFDVILMDVQMPVMDGLSATRAIRAAEASAARSPIPIIGLTANAMIGDIQRCRDVGMDAHVAKPIEWTQLLSAIDDVTALRPRAMALP